MTGQAPTLGTRIKRARGRLSARLGYRVSQQELAIMTGFSRASINRWEKDRAVPTEDILAALGEILGEDLTCDRATPAIDPRLQAWIDALSPEERSRVLAQLGADPSPGAPDEPERHRRAG